jgi:hypothetical protein
MECSERGGLREILGRIIELINEIAIARESLGSGVDVDAVACEPAI